MMRAAQEQAVADFHTAGLDDSCTAPVTLRVGEQAGLRIDCAVRRGRTVLVRQVVAMWVTPAGLYSLSYSAPPASYDAHLADYDRALASAQTR